MSKGTLYWITGLAGAGKTTIGTLLYEYLKSKKNNVVFFDGDVIRKVYQSDDYTLEGRKKMTETTVRLYQLLTEQGIDVVACHIAMYNSCRLWNRNNIPNYKEIYLKVNIEELIRRDQKKLYSRALRGEISNVMGVDLSFEEPQNPDLLINNNGKDSPKTVLMYIVETLNI